MNSKVLIRTAARAFRAWRTAVAQARRVSGLMGPVNLAGLTRLELVSSQARQEPRRSAAAAVLGSVVLWC